MTDNGSTALVTVRYHDGQMRLNASSYRLEFFDIVEEAFQAANRSSDMYQWQIFHKNEIDCYSDERSFESKLRSLKSKKIPYIILNHASQV